MGARTTLGASGGKSLSFGAGGGGADDIRGGGGGIFGGGGGAPGGGGGGNDGGGGGAPGAEASGGGGILEGGGGAPGGGGGNDGGFGGAPGVGIGGGGGSFAGGGAAFGGGGGATEGGGGEVGCTAGGAGGGSLGGAAGAATVCCGGVGVVGSTTPCEALTTPFPTSDEVAASLIFVSSLRFPAVLSTSLCGDMIRGRSSVVRVRCNRTALSVLCGGVLLQSTASLSFFIRAAAVIPDPGTTADFFPCTGLLRCDMGVLRPSSSRATPLAMCNA